MAARSHFLLVALIALSLAGCATQGPFPSLAMRPEEREISIEPPVHEPVTVATDTSLRARIGALVTEAHEGARAFDAAFGETEAAVAGAGAQGSESWVIAQQALSRLQATRAPVTRARAELDQLAIGRAGVPTSREDFAAIDAAIVEVARIASEQEDRLERLQSRISG